MARDQQSDLREALGTYLSAGGSDGGGRVRPEIRASWQRSTSAELQPDRFEVPYEPESGDAERVGRAAKPILECLVQDFALTSMGLVLTDDQGRIVERFVADRTLPSRLDALALALKDVDLALGALDALDRDGYVVLRSLAEEWHQAVTDGLGGDDVTVVARALEKREAHAPA